MAVLGCCLVAPVSAQTPEREPVLNVHLPGQPLGDAVRSLAMQSGMTIIAAPESLAGRSAAPLDGQFTVAEALLRLLAATNLHADRVDGTLVIRPNEAKRPPVIATDVVVVGSRIRGAGATGSNVVTIGREDIERSGYATTQQVIASLPQNYGGGPNEGTVGFSVRNNANANFGYGSSVNLRGLGTTSTLTLIDGNRVGLGSGGAGFVDLTLIPATAIDRIEVLADGSSALYGSDAVAGVVNVRLRRRFEGAETRVRYGFADGFDELQASQLVGLGWAGGHVSLAYEFYRRGALPAADRSFATEDLRPFGGPDYRRSFSNPGTIIAADGRSFAIPRNQNGQGLSSSQLTAGANLADGRANTDLLPGIVRHASMLSVDQAVTDSVKASVQLFWADRRTRTRTFPDNYGNVVVPVSNPFYVDPIGTRQPVTVNYSFERDLGPETNLAHVRNTTAVGGLDGTLGRWSASLQASYGFQREEGRLINIPNYYNLGQALADTNRATAFNLFGDGSFTAPATIDAVRGRYDQIGRSEVWTGTARFEGPLVQLPAGDLRLAIGTEFRRERYSYASTDYEFTPTPVDGGSAGFPISRGVAAVFAEVYLPVIGDANVKTWAHSLDVSLTVRAERYNDFGKTTNPKVGVRWSPLRGLAVRSSFGTSFRAPSFFDVRSGRGTAYYMPFPLPDAGSATGMTNALVLFGANPSVGPEKARTFTVGLDLAPPALAGARVSVGYFNIRYDDRIASLGVDYLSFLGNRAVYGDLIIDRPAPGTVAAFYADQNFHNPFGIAASDIRVILDGRSRNLSSVSLEGIDFDLGYRFGGDRQRNIEVGASGSYILRYGQRITSSAPLANVVSTSGYPVALRARGRIVGSFDRLGAAAFVNYTDAYRNTGVTPAEKVSSWTTIDLQLSYDITRLAGVGKSARLAVNATNLFDRAPPYVNNPTPFSAAGFDPENANPIGRLISIELVAGW